MGIGIPLTVLIKNIIRLRFTAAKAKSSFDHFLNMGHVGTHGFQVSEVSLAPAIFQMIITDVVKMITIHIVVTKQLRHQLFNVGSVPFIIKINTVIIAALFIVIHTGLRKGFLISGITAVADPGMHANAPGMGCVQNLLQNVPAVKIGAGQRSFTLQIRHPAQIAFHQQHDIGGSSVGILAADDLGAIAAGFIHGVGPKPFAGSIKLFHDFILPLPNTGCVLILSTPAYQIRLYKTGRAKSAAVCIKQRSALPTLIFLYF